MINNIPCNNERREDIKSFESIVKTKDNKNDTIASMKTTPDKDDETTNGGSAQLQHGFKNISTNCTVVLNNIRSIRSSPSKGQRKTKVADKSGDDASANSSDIDKDCKLFEFEESETPLLPLYLLRDEGTVQWVLFSDLCYLLKVKSKEALLKQVR